MSRILLRSLVLPIVIATMLPVLTPRPRFLMVQSLLIRSPTFLKRASPPSLKPSMLPAFFSTRAWSSQSSSLRLSRGLSTTPATVVSPKQTNQSAERDEEMSSIYKELQWISNEIRRLDALYYGTSNEQGLTVSDDEYDALCTREAEICQAYPKLRIQWEKQSGLGIQATRFGGRVGSILDEANDAETTATRSTAAITTTGKIRRRHHKPMLSLDNVHDKAQLWVWLERIRKKLVAAFAVNNTLAQPIQVTIFTEPKLDGLSLNLYYKRSNGPDFELQWAATRGDGRQGQDVTAAVRASASIPQTIKGLPTSYGDELEVRGEVVLPKSVFQKHLVDHYPDLTNQTSFSNARNAASGILLRKEQPTQRDAVDGVADDWRSKLCFYAYDLYIPELDMDGLEARELLNSLGFSVPQPSTCTTLVLNDTDSQWNETQITNMLHYYDSLWKHRENLEAKSDFEWGDYDMDGCVHKVSEFRDLLGSSSRAPRWAVAHKFPATAIVTELLDVHVQVGRTGALTPVALLKPVELSGVTIQRATMHNFGHMQHILGNVDKIQKGTKVLVRRAGEVIPQVVSLVGESKKQEKFSNDSLISLATPTKCPACNSPVVVDNRTVSAGRLSLGQVIRCGGPSLLCPPRAVSALQHTFSRDALDISGLSEARIQQLMDNNFLRVPSDIFALVQDSEKVREIAKLDGWGEKSARNLIAEVNRVATEGVSLSRFIFSLGIRFVGVYSSALIAGVYGTADAFLEDVERAGTPGEIETSQDSCSIEILRADNDLTKGIGPAVLSSLVAFSEEKELVEAAKQLAKKVFVHNDNTKGALDHVGGSSARSVDEIPFWGLSVVFTGTIPGMTRSAAQDMAKQMGAKATPMSVSKATDLVISGDKKGGKKIEAALKMGIKVMDASEFLALVQSFQENETKKV